MKQFSRLVFLAGVAGGAAACGASEAPPARHAQAVELMQCPESPTPQGEARLLASTKVLDFEPIYSRVPTGNNDIEYRLNGAKILIRPPQGMTADQMTRALQCHSARVLLGQVDQTQFPNDPYWLPNTWVNIDVTPEEGNFAVRLSADNIPHNRSIFERARVFADLHAITHIQ